jgi:hypothetical protein
MARLRNSEWAMMIVQRALEIDPKKRRKFLSTLKEFELLDTPLGNGVIKRIVENCLPRLEKPNADLRMLGKAKSGLAKINDRENIMEKHFWNFISQHQPGDSRETEMALWKPIIKYCKRIIKKGRK